MNYAAWKKRWEFERRQRELAASTPGEPVPRTGRRPFHRRRRKMAPYGRPRKGGGVDARDNLGYDGPRVGPLD